MEVDLVRKRISLSARRDDAAPRPSPGGPPAQRPQQGRPQQQQGRAPQMPAQPKFTNNPFQKLLRK
jgi:hypothetical protein